MDISYDWRLLDTGAAWILTKFDVSLVHEIKTIKVYLVYLSASSVQCTLPNQNRVVEVDCSDRDGCQSHCTFYQSIAKS